MSLGCGDVWDPVLPGGGELTGTTGPQSGQLWPTVSAATSCLLLCLQAPESRTPMCVRVRVLEKGRLPGSWPAAPSGVCLGGLLPAGSSGLSGHRVLLPGSGHLVYASGRDSPTPTPATPTALQVVTCQGLTGTALPVSPLQCPPSGEGQGASQMSPAPRRGMNGTY